MRRIWRAFVPGDGFTVWGWFLWIGIAIFMGWHGALIVYIPIFALNLYSWDYQRRRAAGLLIIPESPK